MVVFRVANMGCGGCARSITAVLRKVDPTADIRVDLQRREVAVSGDLDAERVARALSDAGFPGQRLAA